MKKIKITDFKPSKTIKGGKFQPYGESWITYGIPIVFFHYWEDGKILYQGFVDSIDKRHGGGVILFEWLMGEMNGRIRVTKAWFDKCTFYHSDMEMNKAHEIAKSEGKA